MKYIIDRIEQNIAICEDDNKKQIEIEVTKLPSNIKEGDIIKQEKGKYIIDEENTEKKREDIRKRMSKLWK